ncbi:MAG: PilZ domain-containing protein [Terriglobales bacterium]
MQSHANTRRWPRYPVNLPVSVLLCDGPKEKHVSGLGIEISEGGMSLYAGIPLQPGDLTEIEFTQPSNARLTAIVRNRTGYWFGLEFISRLPS